MTLTGDFYRYPQRNSTHILRHVLIEQKDSFVQFYIS
jgi:hypothetical protein